MILFKTLDKDKLCLINAKIKYDTTWHHDYRVSRSLKKGAGGIQKKGTWCALSHSKRAHSVRAHCP